jgi:hypothetical protein
MHTNGISFMYNIAVSYIERRLTMHPLKEAMIKTLWHTQQSEPSGKIKDLPKIFRSGK